MNAQQLKNSILQEAIEGRLVPQDPNDEPASVLLDKIRKEKEKLVKEGKLKKKDLQEASISEDEIPFKIPKNWEWTRLKNHVSASSGLAYKKDDLATFSNEYVRVLRGGNISFGSWCIKDDDIMIGKQFVNEELMLKKGMFISPAVTSLEHIGKTALIRKDQNDIVAGGFVLMLLPHYKNDIYLEYLNILFQSGYYRESCKKITNKSGQAFFNLSRAKLLELVIPIPPLNEQHRIVEKIEELMPKVEEYGKAQEALDKLNTELPEQLKKSILQEAIEGRLVPQDPNDEPASVLLDKIRKEKEKLVKEGKLKKKDLQEIPISEEEIPFKIPKSWEIVRLGEITYNHGQKKPNGDFSYIDIGSIDNKQQKLNNIENIIKEKDAPSRARKIIKYDDVIYATVRPYLHNICIIDKKFSKEPIASTGFAVLSCIKGLYNKFLFYYLISPIFDAYANDGDNAKGMAYPAINDKKLYSGIVPLPPLAEQHRIVEKIEELLRKIEILKENK